LSDGTEDDVGDVGLPVVDALMAELRRNLRLMLPNTPRFWPEMKTRRRCSVSWRR
jgi:hypothetical protein